MLDKMYNPDPQIITTKTYYFTFKASTKEEVDYLVKVLNNHDEYFSFSELHKYVEEKLPDGVILQSRASNNYT